MKTLKSKQVNKAVAWSLVVMFSLIQVVPTGWANPVRPVDELDRRGVSAPGQTEQEYEARKANEEKEKRIPNKYMDFYTQGPLSEPVIRENKEKIVIRPESERKPEQAGDKSVVESRSAEPKKEIATVTGRDTQYQPLKPEASVSPNGAALLQQLRDQHANAQNTGETRNADLSGIGKKLELDPLEPPSDLVLPDKEDKPGIFVTTVKTEEKAYVVYTPVVPPSVNVVTDPATGRQLSVTFDKNGIATVKWGEEEYKSFYDPRTNSLIIVTKDDSVWALQFAKNDKGELHLQTFQTRKWEGRDYSEETYTYNAQGQLIRKDWLNEYSGLISCIPEKQGCSGGMLYGRNGGTIDYVQINGKTLASHEKTWSESDWPIYYKYNLTRDAERSDVKYPSTQRYETETWYSYDYQGNLLAKNWNSTSPWGSSFGQETYVHINGKDLVSVRRTWQYGGKGSYYYDYEKPRIEVLYETNRVADELKASVPGDIRIIEMPPHFKYVSSTSVTYFNYDSQGNLLAEVNVFEGYDAQGARHTSGSYNVFNPANQTWEYAWAEGINPWAVQSWRDYGIIEAAAQRKTVYVGGHPEIGVIKYRVEYVRENGKMTAKAVYDGEGNVSIVLGEPDILSGETNDITMKNGQQVNGKSVYYQEYWHYDESGNWVNDGYRLVFYDNITGASTPVDFPNKKTVPLDGKDYTIRIENGDLFLDPSNPVVLHETVFANGKLLITKEWLNGAWAYFARIYDSQGNELKAYQFADNPARSSWDFSDGRSLVTFSGIQPDGTRVSIYVYFDSQNQFEYGYVNETRDVLIDGLGRFTVTEAYQIRKFSTGERLALMNRSMSPQESHSGGFLQQHENFGYDENGQLSFHGIRHYQYDESYRLISSFGVNSYFQNGAVIYCNVELTQYQGNASLAYSLRYDEVNVVRNGDFIVEINGKQNGVDVLKVGIDAKEIRIEGLSIPKRLPYGSGYLSINTMEGVPGFLIEIFNSKGELLKSLPVLSVYISDDISADGSRSININAYPENGPYIHLYSYFNESTQYRVALYQESWQVDSPQYGNVWVLERYEIKNFSGEERMVLTGRELRHMNSAKNAWLYLQNETFDYDDVTGKLKKHTTTLYDADSDSKVALYLQITYTDGVPEYLISQYGDGGELHLSFKDLKIERDANGLITKMSGIVADEKLYQVYRNADGKVVLEEIPLPPEVRAYRNALQNALGTAYRVSWDYKDGKYLIAVDLKKTEDCTPGGVCPEVNYSTNPGQMTHLSFEMTKDANGKFGLDVTTLAVSYNVGLPTKEEALQGVVPPVVDARLLYTVMGWCVMNTPCPDMAVLPEDRLLMMAKLRVTRVWNGGVYFTSEGNSFLEAGVEYVAYRDANGKAVLLRAAVKDFADQLQEQLGNTFKVTLEPDLDLPGAYLVRVEDNTKCGEEKCFKPGELESMLVKLDFQGRFTGVKQAVYQGIGEVDAQLLYEALWQLRFRDGHKIMPKPEDPELVLRRDPVDPALKDSIGQLLADHEGILYVKIDPVLITMTHVLVTPVDQVGAVHFTTEDGKGYLAYRDEAGAVQIKPDIDPGDMYLDSIAAAFGVNPENIVGYKILRRGNVCFGPGCPAWSIEVEAEVRGEDGEIRVVTGWVNGPAWGDNTVIEIHDPVLRRAPYSVTLEEGKDKYLPEDDSVNYQPLSFWSVVSDSSGLKKAALKVMRRWLSGSGLRNGIVDGSAQSEQGSDSAQASLFGFESSGILFGKILKEITK